MSSPGHPSNGMARAAFCRVFRRQGKMMAQWGIAEVSFGLYRLLWPALSFTQLPGYRHFSHRRRPFALFHITKPTVAAICRVRSSVAEPPVSVYASLFSSFPRVYAANIFADTDRFQKVFPEFADCLSVDPKQFFDQVSLVSPIFVVKDPLF